MSTKVAVAKQYGETGSINMHYLLDLSKQKIPYRRGAVYTIWHYQLNFFIYFLRKAAMIQFCILFTPTYPNLTHRIIHLVESIPTPQGCRCVIFCVSFMLIIYFNDVKDYFNLPLPSFFPSIIFFSSHSSSHYETAFFWPFCCGSSLSHSWRAGWRLHWFHWPHLLPYPHSTITPQILCTAASILHSFSTLLKSLLIGPCF